jgi:hypothetical protein
VTPHAITFYDYVQEEENASIGADYPTLFEVPASGFIVNAKPVEENAGKAAWGNSARLVRTRFDPDPATEETLQAVQKAGVLAVGSIIAAQAYPGLVLAMTPAPGYERAAPAEKRMNPWKYTTFGPNGVGVIVRNMSEAAHVHGVPDNFPSTAQEAIQVLDHLIKTYNEDVDAAIYQRFTGAVGTLGQDDHRGLRAFLEGLVSTDNETSVDMI